MTSAGETAEDRIIAAAIPIIRRLCQGRWLNLEFEDRYAEALLYFVEMLRSMPLTTGHFFKDYLDRVSAYLDKLNRKTPSMRFGHFSLDAPIAGSEGDEIDGYCVLPSCISDFSKPLADAFISSLPDDERRIVCLRMSGCSKQEAARELNMSAYRLEKALDSIQRRYTEWSSEE